MHEDEAITEALSELIVRQRREHARRAARSPKGIAGVMAEVLQQRGYARLLGQRDLDDAWRQAAGDAAARESAPGKVRRGVLEVVVAHSTLIQELTFAKGEIVRRLAELVPHERIRDVRFRVGRPQ
ncbi:MAG: DUF721 domain-containing protein [Pirellulales bacterium]